MDFANYTDLQAALADYLTRNDLAAQIPAFITLAEGPIRRRVRRKTIRKTDAVFTAGQDSFTLPADCGELRSARLVTANPHLDLPLKIGSVEQLAERRACSSAAGRPWAGAVVDGKLLLVSVPDQNYTAELTYFEKLVPLATSSTNSVLTEAPDIYLYGSLLQAAPYLEHDERIPVWKAYFDDAIEELNTARQNEEFGASLRPAKIRPFG